ncbi:hypothetical protein BYT27DRAFT_6708685 [Phlegmacium glaucopus]|nr:hypothetical protein BYT27DRAFT_6708685 [Phlegmacium glaucopus]
MNIWQAVETPKINPQEWTRRLRVSPMEFVLLPPGVFFGVPSWCLSQQTPTSCVRGRGTAALPRTLPRILARILSRDLNSER